MLDEKYTLKRKELAHIKSRLEKMEFLQKEIERIINWVEDTNNPDIAKDWSNAEEGDLLKCISSDGYSIGNFTEGEYYPVILSDVYFDGTVLVGDNDSAELWIDDTGAFEVVSEKEFEQSVNPLRKEVQEKLGERIKEEDTTESESESESQFKVGDIIIGKSESKDRYFITTDNVVMEVIEVGIDNGFFPEDDLRVEVIKTLDDEFGVYVGDRYSVDSEYFELYKPSSEIDDSEEIDEVIDVEQKDKEEENIYEFKVGDIVTGKPEAGEEYSITTSNAIMEVVEVGDRYIRVKVEKYIDGSEGNKKFYPVLSKFFEPYDGDVELETKQRQEDKNREFNVGDFLVNRTSSSDLPEDCIAVVLENDGDEQLNLRVVVVKSVDDDYKGEFDWWTSTDCELVEPSEIVED